MKRRGRGEKKEKRRRGGERESLWPFCMSGNFCKILCFIKIFLYVTFLKDSSVTSSVTLTKEVKITIVITIVFLGLPRHSDSTCRPRGSLLIVQDSYETSYPLCMAPSGFIGRGP